MMRTSDQQRYKRISSFTGFRVEKERLTQKKLFIEERIDLSFKMISRMVSVSTQVFNLAKDIFIPKLSELLKGWLNKNADTTGEEENQPKADSNSGE